MNQPLGFGLTRPFRRDQRDFAAAGGEQLIRSAVGQILGTIGASEFIQGEVPWRTDFGSSLHVLQLQRNGPVLRELARVYVIDALKRWEPRVVATSVESTSEWYDGVGIREIRLRYDVTPTNGTGTNVIVSGMAATVLA
jgi:phage baseplate assembly protein W